MCVLLYTIAKVFQLYLGSDMMSEKTRRKPAPILSPTQGIFNLPHHIVMVWEELAFDDAVSYTQWWKWISAQLKVMAVTGFVPLVPSLINPAP